MQIWGVNYLLTYASVLNWIIVRSLLAIASIHSLLIRSIDFVLAFPQYGLDGDVFMDITLEMGVDESRGYWVLMLN